jgi:hypothetical protein
LQDRPKFTQIGIFGLKMHHLATLVDGPRFKEKQAKNMAEGCGMDMQKKKNKMLQAGYFCQGPILHMYDRCI